MLPSDSWYEGPDENDDESYFEYLETGGHPYDCRCPECDPDYHRDVMLDR